MTPTLWSNTIQERFYATLAAHPEIYTEFKKAAHKLRRAGHRRASAKLITEHLRWKSMVNPERYGGWKINNNFTSRLARLLIEEEPEFATFFSLRELKA